MVCSGQAEKEFRVEVEAIGHVRHKNLVRLLGYCIEGVHRQDDYLHIAPWTHDHAFSPILQQLLFSVETGCWYMSMSTMAT